MQLRNIPLLLAGALLPVAQAALRQHTLELTYATHNADGTTRESWLINGQTPGPHLVWDEDDEISVRVVNKGHEPVAMHWHGIEQFGTPWSDGVPGLTQWPIPVQGDFVYTLLSSSWLHPAQIAALDKNVYFSYPNGSVVDIIFTVTAGNPAMHPPHPMHKHGVKAWFLGSGEGKFPYASIKDAVDAGYKGINMKNPPLRDDFVTPVAITGNAWAAVRFRAVDPGPIILHCHIDAHLATGMVIVLLEGAEKLTSGYVPNYYLSKNKP
ncbi:multicopper oxidase, partial [Rhizoctonia solani AG-3 Rhs1AP]